MFSKRWILVVFILVFGTTSAWAQPIATEPFGLENGSESVTLTPSPPPDLRSAAEVFSQNAGEVGTRNRRSAGLLGITPLSLAPNPEGPNLAFLAIPSVSSTYPIATPYWYNPVVSMFYTPDRAINGDYHDFWHSAFGGPHWYRLTWPTPVNIKRIYLDHKNGLPYPNWVQQTYTRIDYENASTGAWITIPGSSFVTGYNLPSIVDFTFPPVSARSIIVYLRTGPINPHPHGAVYIFELEVYGSQQEVLSVQSYPNDLWVSLSGVSSGIVFRATTRKPGAVSFYVRKEPQGPETFVGSHGTSDAGGENVAKLTWWGNLGGSLAPEGSYTVIARAGSSEKTAGFQVKKTIKPVLGMGKWMTHTKDPGAVVPVIPQDASNQCLFSWQEAIGEKEGYSGGIGLSDPVDIFSGNYIYPEIDLSLKSRLSLTLARVYNALDPYEGPFGRGWSSPFLMRIEMLASDALFVNSDGSRVLFTKTGNGFQAPYWTDLRLGLATDTGYWRLNHPYGDEWHFDENGRLIRIARACCGQAAADAVTVEYDGNGRLWRVTTPPDNGSSSPSPATGLLGQPISAGGPFLTGMTRRGLFWSCLPTPWAGRRPINMKKTGS